MHIGSRKKQAARETLIFEQSALETRQASFYHSSERYAALGKTTYFSENACNYCEGVFAEVADVVLMDAWLPKYEVEPEGHSIVIVRNPLLKRLLEEGNSKGSCSLERIPVELAVNSNC